MPTLNVTDFSCLRDASFKLAPVNVIIGPQGSGKSVTTKLFYFLSDIMTNVVLWAEKGESLDGYKQALAKQFCLWFPPTAWGQGRFNINYSAGPFYVRIMRRKSKGKLLDDVAVTFSDAFSRVYNSITNIYDNSKHGDSSDIDDQVELALDKAWRIRELANRKLIAEIGDEYLGQQTFIPAGRAFFTSIGRLVAGFEQAGSLDPVTIKFARLFANIRDRSWIRYSPRSNMGDDFLNRRLRFMDELFGGEVKFENELEYVETKDGRRVPFSSLSSGQQELLPMWTLMDYLNERDAFRTSRNVKSRRPRELVYIEEPEAHLFPSAQSLLMEFLISSIASERNRRSLIITTHSPYIMGKLNVFLKAGQLSRRKRKNQEINDVVPRECWLHDSQVAAFAIDDGALKNILDEDGLIDGRYLDSISEEISRQFSKLLQIESEM